MNKIKLKIVSLERDVLSEEVEQISLDTKMGQITILPNHIPLVAQLVPGEIVIKKSENEEEVMAVSGGFVEVSGSGVVVLADTAEYLKEIDEARALEAKKRAEELLKEKQVDSEEYAMISAKLQKELARLKVARRRKKSEMGIYTGK